MGGEKFLVGLRGLNIFQSRFGSFSDPFSRFSNRFSYRFKLFSGAVSFCTRAALKNEEKKSGEKIREKNPTAQKCQNPTLTIVPASIGCCVNSSPPLISPKFRGLGLRGPVRDTFHIARYHSPRNFYKLIPLPVFFEIFFCNTLRHPFFFVTPTRSSGSRVDIAQKPNKSGQILDQR